MIPKAVADEVRAYFEDLTAWLATVSQQGSAKKRFKLRDDPAVEARTFISTVHGAMLTARALDDPETFACISRAAIERLTSA